MSNMIQEFKDFALKGNFIDMATGIIIGGAAGTVVKSLVDDVVMPPIGYFMGGVKARTAMRANSATGTPTIT